MRLASLFLVCLASSFAQQGDTSQSCSVESSLAPRKAGNAARIEFANRTGKTVNVYLRNDARQRLFLRSLAPGEKFSQSAAEGQPFVVTDTAGRCLEVHQASSVESHAQILAAQPAATASGPIIQTFAGTDYTFQSDGQPAVNAAFGQLRDVALDSAGNLYFPYVFNQVYSVTTDGNVHILAGNGFRSCCSSGIPARNASLTEPRSTTVGPDGSIYIGGGGYIVKVSPAGIITTVTGGGNNFSSGGGGKFSGDNGAGIKAGVGDFDLGINFDPAGNLYFCDARNNRVRKIDTNGIITTVAGNGTAVFSGDGGPAINAGIAFPRGLRFDAAGNMFISDANGRIRKVAPDGTISTFATGISPASLDFDSGGNLYTPDFAAHKIYKISPDGKTLTVIAGTTQGFSGDGGLATKAQFNQPDGIKLDKNGNIFISDSNNGRIRRIDTNGVITTVAGNGLFRFSPDGTPAILSFFQECWAVAVSPSGLLYISDRFAGSVYRVEADGTRTRVAGTGTSTSQPVPGPVKASTTGLTAPDGLAFDRNGNLYIADSARVYKVAPDGTLTTLAGGGGDTSDGVQATKASIAPADVAVDPAGNVFIAENTTTRQRIRKVTTDGIITTLAGAGPGYQDGPGAQALFSGLQCITADAAGNIYVCDAVNNLIRKITPDGTVSTFAGGGKTLGNGGPALQASIFSPSALAFDPSGALLVSQAGAQTVRRITPDGIINLFAGNGQAKFAGDGGPAQLASFYFPQHIASDSAGNIFVADSQIFRVRVIPAVSPSLSVTPTSLSFTVRAGSATPVPQTINLTSAVVGLPYTTTINGAFIQLTTTSAATPATENVTVDASKLAPGPYTGTITFTPAVTGAAPVSVTVNLTVQPALPSLLAIDTTGLSFTLTKGGPAANQRIVVSDSGGGSVDFTVSAKTNSGGNWLSVTPGAGTTTPTSTISLLVTADPTGLAAGTYSGSVIVADEDGETTIPVPVALTVSGTGQIIRLSQAGLTLLGVVGGGVSPPQNVTVLNLGQGAFQFTAKALNAAGQSWLSVSPSTGTSDVSKPFPVVSISVNPAGLSAGDYYGRVEISSPTADDSPEDVTIALHLLPAGSDPGPFVQPAGLVFVGVAGGSDPPSQTVIVTNISATPLSFGSGVATLDGGKYINYQPPFSSLPQGTEQVVVQPSFQGLAPGVYLGAITFVFSDFTVQTVEVLIDIAPAGTIPGSSNGMAATPATGCTPTRLLPLITSLGANFNVPASFPTALQTRVIDDCGTPVTSGSVVSSFSSGDAPLSMVSLGDGNWSGTWVSRNTSQRQVSITGTADMPRPQLRGQIQVTGGLSGNATPPVIGSGGIVSASSFAAQAPLAPGAMISIFGSKLGNGTAPAPSLPLTTQLAGATLVIAGQSMPLLYASDGQINAILPFGLPLNTRLQVIATNSSQVSVPEEITIAPASPGVFVAGPLSQGHIYVGANRADSNNPARAGDEIVIYCSGLGPVNVPVVDGAASPTAPIAFATNIPTVTIGGVNARVDFAGLTPGFAGLYQINASIPSGITPGAAVPLVITSAGQSSVPVTMAVR